MWKITSLIYRAMFIIESTFLILIHAVWEVYGIIPPWHKGGFIIQLALYNTSGLWGTAGKYKTGEIGTL